MSAQQALHTHLPMIKETVGRFGFGSAATSLGNVRLRTSKKISRDQHRSPSQPLVGQLGQSQLFFGPILRGRWRQADRWRGMIQSSLLGLRTQDRAEVFHQRINPERFLAQPGSVLAILAAATAADADGLPVGRRVAGSRKTRQIDKTFQQDWL